MRRPLFTDGFNSVGHVLFGVLSKWWLWFVPIFFIYQILDYDDVNLSVDIAEYLIGLMAAMALTSSSWMTAGLTFFAATAFAYHFHASGEKTTVQQMFKK